MADNEKAVARRDPFASLLRSRLFDRWLLDDRFPLLWDAEDVTTPVDISRKDNNIIVRASVPGFDANELEVHVTGGVLSIKGEHKEQSETKDERYFRRERRAEYCSRQVELPESVDEDKVTAEYKQGVLTITAPVAAASANRVEVKPA